MEDTEKIGFFKKVKISIFNLEKYKIFTKERFFESVKYLLIIVAIVTLILSISSTIKSSKGINKLVEYIKSEFPEFTLADGKLNAEGKLEAYDSEYDSKLIVDTNSEISEEEIKAYEKKAKETTNAAILLNEKTIYYIKGQRQEIKYEDILDLIGKESLNKEELVNSYFTQNSLNSFYFEIWIAELIMVFMLNILTLIEDVIIVAVFGIISAKLSRVKLTFSQVASIAIHSLTLSIILSTAYVVVNVFSSFEIQYFEAMYMILAYIYLVASIMIMKDDFDKTASDVVTVEGQVIKSVTEENENEEDENKNKDKDKNKDKENKDDELGASKDTELESNNINKEDNEPKEDNK